MTKATRICGLKTCGKVNERAGQAKYCSSLCKERAALARRKDADPDFHAKWRAATDRPRAKYSREHRAARWPSREPGYHVAYHREYAKANPDRIKAIRAMRRARVKDAPIAPFTLEDLASRMAYFGNKCWMCSGPFEEVDHVKPLAKGGSHMLSNFRPSCNRCNYEKRAEWFGVTELHRFLHRPSDIERTR